MTPPKPRIEHDNKARTSTFIQGKVKFEVDSFSMEHTLGVANYDNKGVLDALPDKVIHELAEMNDWPHQPLDRQAIRWIVMGHVEITMRTDVTGEAPARCVENQNKRIEKYKADFNNIAKKAQEKKDRPHAGGSVAHRWWYKPTAEILKATFKGQQLEIFKFFVEYKDGGEPKTIVEFLTKAGVKASQPLERVVAYYMNQWRNDGYLTREEMPDDEPVKTMK